MSQTAIPFHFLRGGTSRGPYLDRADLPEDRETLAEVLIAMVGSGHPLNIDGIGGGAAVTTKVAMLSKSDDEWADIDYFFAQVSVESRLVDFKPTCGNILVGVGPAALEMGLIAPTGDETEVRIRAVNTGARVMARVQTPGGAVSYDGDAAIDGVPGTAAPIALNFMDVTGGATGALFPTGAKVDTIDGIDVTCMDVAMPMAIARADAFGLTGYETAEELDANRAFYDRMEPIRREAGRRMGMGDVSQSVTPKFGLVAPARDGGAAAVRYFMPWNCHPSLAVTGSQCMAACLLCPGTVAEGIMAAPNENPVAMALEHPMGQLHVVMDVNRDDPFTVNSAGLVRTARLLARGEVFVPRHVWSG
ncbi:4-oxalomesaconate tautomerase [Pseudaestuariivita atlantica]|uniref:Isomerase YbhH n=1 Tax=Pseudaestuariivita atlantica TaxID=1317121 RepID=A0A0L1JNC3_9RHOB|nr:4-oxalomesaconate tautomerase [Pseudaestuariivita atlantica]KNG93254.1 isomerase YbhH [Pseudaestuariivita atlantica]